MFTTFIAWLSKRFPEKLVITLQEYKEMREELGQYNIAMQQLAQLNERVMKLERDVTQLNNANGFVNTAKGAFKLER